MRRLQHIRQLLRHVEAARDEARTRSQCERCRLRRAIDRAIGRRRTRRADAADRKSTRLNSVTNAHLVCRLLLEKKKHTTKKTKSIRNNHTRTHSYLHTH